MSAPPLIVCGELPGAGGAAAAAASTAIALASVEDTAPFAGGDGAAVVVELGAEERRGPTMLASDGARRLERALRDAGFAAAARGRLTWVSAEEDVEQLAECVRRASGAVAVLALLDVARWPALLEESEVTVAGALIRADLPAQRALAALAVGELRGTGLAVRIAARPLGRVAARRALAGIDPGGDAGRRATRLSRALTAPRRAAAPAGTATASEAGQALPLVLGAVALLIACALALAALGGAAAGVARAQRVADLAALSAARSMRDDFDALFVPARLPNGIANPAHVSKADYLARARGAALEAARRNRAGADRVEVRFPDAESFAPLRARVTVSARHETSAADREVDAVAEAVSPAATNPPADPTIATGGGYAGPLAHRGGEPMRPDVARAFDRLAGAARADGVALIVNSGYRSDAEQAALFAANPDPRWVAPPGRSLHRCGTELDLGPPAAYSWLSVHASRFGFVRRYAWEPWHYGYAAGPPPCSARASRIHPGVADGPAARSDSLPEFVPARFRAPLAAAAARWNVSAAVLAAQLMAESNFNPSAVSAAGAAGIAQFMPATAASYGLRDRFDPDAAIHAQAHLMSDLLRRFGGRVALALAAYNAGPAPVDACLCVPDYPETRAYVARILGLLEGAGAIVAPALEVRLVS